MVKNHLVFFVGSPTVELGFFGQWSKGGTPKGVLVMRGYRENTGADRARASPKRRNFFFFNPDALA